MSDGHWLGRPTRSAGNMFTGFGEEQNATTNEMERNLSEAAHCSGEITSNIAGVAQAAEGTTRGATNTQKASQQLVKTSAQLRRLVEQFKVNASGNARSAPPAHSASS